LKESINTEEEKSKILNLNGDGTKIISHLLSLSVELPYESDLLPKFIKELEDENNLNFLSACLHALESKADVFRVATLMKDTVLLLPNIDPSTLVEILNHFSIKMKGDMAAGLFHGTLQSLVRDNPSLASKLEQEIKLKETHDLLGYLLAIYVGVASKNFQDGYLKILAMINDNEPAIKSFGLRGLGSLEEEIKTKEEEVIKILISNNSSDNTQISANSVFSTFRLLRYFDSLQNEALKLSLSEVAEIQYEVSSYLRFDDNYLKDWQKEAILNVTKRTRSKNKGITDHLDSIMYSLQKKHSNFEFVKNILNLWIESRTTKEIIEYKIDDTFRMATTVFAVKKELMSPLLTEWFNHDNYNFHKAASCVVDYFKLHKIKPTELNTDYLKSLDYDSSLFMIRKILGFTHNFNYTATYLFSFFLNKDVSTDLCSLVSSVFIEHLGYNYPHQTIKFLEKNTEQESSSIASKYFELIKKELAERTQLLESLERINELRPELDTLWKIENKRQKSMSKAMEGAREGSIFNFATNISIKEGKSWFSYMHGQYSDVSTMAHISESIELPRADVLDVVGASMERQGFRIAKRGEK
jgi:hypothetical protein